MARKSNCLFWAWRKWKDEGGGYICFRKSSFWQGFHVLWLRKEGDKFLHFTPLKRFYNGKKLKWWQWPVLFLFKGHIKEGDSGEK